jgi:gamma-glutamylcysteine synthetase
VGASDIEAIRDDRHRGRVMRKARNQLKALSRRRRRRRLNRTPTPNLGLEYELCLIRRDTGRPFHGLAKIIIDELTAQGETRVVHELASWLIELNLTARDLCGSPLSDLNDECQVLIRKVSDIAARHGGLVLAIGILPTAGPQDVQRCYLAPVDRYHVLVDSLGTYQPGTTIKLTDADGAVVSVEITDILPEMICTSVQPHLYFPGLDNVAWMHNVVMATAGPLMAVFGNAPFALGLFGGKDARTQFFGASTNWRCYVEGFIHDAFGIVAQSLKFPALLCKKDQIPGWLTGLFGRFSQATSLALGIGTGWQMVDRTIHKDLDFRHEIRYGSAGPLADVMSFVAILGGLLANPASARLAELLGETNSITNYHLACQEGIEGEYQWADHTGNVETRSAAAIVRDVLIPYALIGWTSLGLRSEAERFLQPLIDRVNTGDPVITLADWQLLRVEAYRHQGLGHETAVGQMTVDYAHLFATGRSVAYWPSPADVPVPTS